MMPAGLRAWQQASQVRGGGEEAMMLA